MSPLQIACEALKKAERQFLSYAEHHAAKGAAKAAEKAMANVRMVDEMRAAIAAIDDAEDDTAAETRGWNAAIEAAANLAKLAWASADFKLVGMEEVKRAILLCEHSDTEIRTLTKPEGTDND